MRSSYRTEFAEMHFDEAPWRGVGKAWMKGIKSKVGSGARGGKSRKYVQANTHNYAARAASVVTNAERTSSPQLLANYLWTPSIFFRA